MKTIATAPLNEAQIQAKIPSGLVFMSAGRPLIVNRAVGTEANAPVIVEELTRVGKALPGQFSLWSAHAVAEACANPDYTPSMK